MVYTQQFPLFSLKQLPLFIEKKCILSISTSMCCWAKIWPTVNPYQHKLYKVNHMFYLFNYQLKREGGLTVSKSSNTVEH